MFKDVQLALSPALAADESIIEQKAIKKSGFHPSKVGGVKVLKKSIDARGRNPIFRLIVRVFPGQVPTPSPSIISQFSPVDEKQEVLIVIARSC